MTWFLPSGVMRVSVWRAISTRITDPSAIATGPSGNFRPEASSLIFGSIVLVCMALSPLLRR